ncbi:hypothetical protein DPMN_010809 [Dreissena polymorpha]|uniref:Uncharacterized protein n=1 Tax=Dreissena polymorpha TaxID=45954 RepID=A0A9D4N2X6_DREPO|nr:hypothetical protein DPMN_010809 [Dreissena polymorpha]
MIRLIKNVVFFRGNSLTTSARISSDTSVTAVLNVATTSSERVATLTQETDWSKSFIHTQAGRPDIHPSSSPLRIEQPIEVASPHGYLPLQRQCGIAPAQVSLYVLDSTCTGQCVCVG